MWSSAGATVWLTGLPAAGKTSLALELIGLLEQRGIDAHHLDGDALRLGLCADLTFDRESRRENVRRAAELAKLLAAQGAVSVVSLVSPYATDRNAARALHAAAEVAFVEVWLDTPLAECRRRDPKGLYRRSNRGQIKQMTGVDDPYEPPAAPELVLRPDDGDPRQCARLVIEVLGARISGDESHARDPARQFSLL